MIEVDRVELRLGDRARDLAATLRERGVAAMLRDLRDLLAADAPDEVDATRRAARVLWDLELLPDERALVEDALDGPEAVALLGEAPATRRLVDGRRERRQLEKELKEEHAATPEGARQVAGFLRALTEEARAAQDLEALRRRAEDLEAALAALEGAAP